MSLYYSEELQDTSDCYMYLHMLESIKSSKYIYPAVILKRGGKNDSKSKDQEFI